jgi:1-deoxy-D-xylulose-5-phosphate synthase
LFDIAYLRCLPLVVGMAPKDEDELQDMMFTATQQAHPCFIRYPRGTAEGVPIKEQPRLLEVGKAEVLQGFQDTGGSRIALFALGNMQTVARHAAAQLREEGHDVALINPRFFKPLDAEVHERFGRGADVVATLEDHVLQGGYGSAVLELFNETGIATPLVRLGWPDQFIEHASSVDYLRTKHGLTVAALTDRIRKTLGAAESRPLSARLAMASVS